MLDDLSIYGYTTIAMNSVYVNHHKKMIVAYFYPFYYMIPYRGIFEEHCFFTTSHNPLFYQPDFSTRSNYSFRGSYDEIAETIMRTKRDWIKQVIKQHGDKQFIK